MPESMELEIFGWLDEWIKGWKDDCLVARMIPSELGQLPR